MRRTSIVLLAGLSILLAVGNVLQWRSRHKPIAEDEVIGRFAQIWTDRLNFDFGSSWLGIQTLQNPTDAWVTQEIVQQVKPDFIDQDTGMWRPLEDPAWASQGVQEFLETAQDFEVDHDRERFLVTNNPRGYLKRVDAGTQRAAQGDSR